MQSQHVALSRTGVLYRHLALSAQRKVRLHSLPKTLLTHLCLSEDSLSPNSATLISAARKGNTYNPDKISEEQMERSQTPDTSSAKYKKQNSKHKGKIFI